IFFQSFVVIPFLLRFRSSVLLVHVPDGSFLEWLELFLLWSVHVVWWIVLYFMTGRAVRDWRQQIGERKPVELAPVAANIASDRETMTDDPSQGRETKWKINALPAEALILTPFFFLLALGAAQLYPLGLPNFASDLLHPLVLAMLFRV